MTGFRAWSDVIGSLCELMTAHYLDEARAQKVNDHLRHRLADGAYQSIANEEALARRITADTVAVSGDQHLQLRYSIAPVQAGPDGVVPESGRHPSEAASSAHGFVRVERRDGNIGIVEVRRLFPLSMSRHAAIAAMHLVADTDALVIDIRRCGGGEPDMVAFLCSYLLDGRVHLTDLHFPREGRTIEWWTDPDVPSPRFGSAKPLFVLIGPDTISAGEGLAYDLQQQGRAMLVGETTAGAANFDYRYRVTDHLMFSVPSGHPINAVSGAGWEGTGIDPDIATSAADAFDVAYELALRHVASLGGSGYRRRVLDEVTRALSGLGSDA